MRLEDAPPDLARLFFAWLSAGRPAHLHRALLERLYPLRGAWLVAGPYVVWLAKVSDRRDEVIRFNKRSLPLYLRRRPEIEAREEVYSR